MTNIGCPIRCISCGRVSALLLSMKSLPMMIKAVPQHRLHFLNYFFAHRPLGCLFPRRIPIYRASRIFAPYGASRSTTINRFLGWIKITVAYIRFPSKSVPIRTLHPTVNVATSQIRHLHILPDAGSDHLFSLVTNNRISCHYSVRMSSVLCPC